MLTVLFLVVMVMPLADPLTKLMPFSVYAKAYYSSAQLQNECSSEDGITNCANNNAETIGDENIVSPQDVAVDSQGRVYASDLDEILIFVPTL
jgi:hypothetical protein